ncbi:MAG: glycosyltransferase family 4 protein [Myxococcota bacterium]|nr:glycosyltransferase family 4 protein [Myxococcota bacterium]
MNIGINAASANSGGAVTYLRNVVPGLSRSVASNGGGRVLVWAPRDAVSGLRSGDFDYRDPMEATNAAGLAGIARRLWFDQWELPRRLRQDRVDALFSSANFGTLRSPVPQVVLVRNSLYFDPLAMGRIRSPIVRARYVAMRALVVRSILVADAVLFPTRAMLDLVTPYVKCSREKWHVAPYGARHDLFQPAVRDRAPSERVVLLHVSVYYDQKNLGTLFGALDRLHAGRPGRYRLRMTSGLRSVRPGPIHPNLEAEREASLRLERDGVVEDLGPRNYTLLPDLYRGADIFVFPSYTESFGHPLVEAMASGLPIVAADVPVNREMCREAAIYFSPFDADACAEAIARVSGDPTLAGTLRAAGRARALDFTWERHVDVLWSAFRGMSP